MTPTTAVQLIRKYRPDSNIRQMGKGGACLVYGPVFSDTLHCCLVERYNRVHGMYEVRS